MELYTHSRKMPVLSFFNDNEFWSTEVDISGIFIAQEFWCIPVADFWVMALH